MSATEPELPEPDSLAGKVSRRLRVRGVRRSVGIFVFTVVAALIAAIPVLYLAGTDPVTAYKALFGGSLGNQRGIAESLIAMSPLLLAGLAVAIAFQAGLFNIGVEGQLVVGGLVAGAVGAEISMPAGVHLAVTIAAAMAAGALWALVPGILKATRGVHEVISTIMFNYVAFALSLWLVSPGGLLVAATQPSATEKVLDTAALPRLWAPTRLHAGVFVALAAAVWCWFFLYRTPAGFRFRVVGANHTAARFAGMSPRRTTVQAMALSGALAGLAGAVEVLGLHGRYFDSFSPGYGFDAIAVALLGLLNPAGVAVAAVFFGILRAGSVPLQAQADVSRDMITVISGLVVAFVAARLAIGRLLVRRRGRPVVAAAEFTPSPAASLAEAEP